MNEDVSRYAEAMWKKKNDGDSKKLRHIKNILQVSPVSMFNQCRSVLGNVINSKAANGSGTSVRLCVIAEGPFDADHLP